MSPSPLSRNGSYVLINQLNLVIPDILIIRPLFVQPHTINYTDILNKASQMTTKTYF